MDETKTEEVAPPEASTQRVPRPRWLTPLQMDDVDEAADKLAREVLRARAALIAGDAATASRALADCQGLIADLARAGKDIGVRAPGPDLSAIEHCITLDQIVGGPSAALQEMPPTEGLDVWTHVGHLRIGPNGEHEANFWVRPKP